MFKITGATVNRNKLFLLNDITTIEYNPESPYQVLMGDNGSGKSTLLRLLTAYDPEAAEFHKAGSVRLRLDAEGTKYEVGYDINGGIRYTFKIDGEEANDGGTREVYRALWKEELNITQNTMAIMTGKNRRLTRMRPAERQAVFATVTGVDMTYGFAAYDKLRKRANGVRGAMKEDKDLIARLEAQRIDPEEQTILTARVLDYRSKATQYMQRYNPEFHYLAGRSEGTSIAHTLKCIPKLVGELRGLLREWPDNKEIDADSAASVVLALQEMTSNVEHLQEWKTGLLDQYTHMDDLQTRMRVQLSMDGMELSQEYTSLRDANVALRKMPYHRADLHYDDPRAILMALHKVLPAWQQEVVSFTGGITQKDTHKRLGDVTERISGIHAGLNRLTAEVEAQETHLKHLREHQDDNCPKCGYSATGEARTKSILNAEGKIASYTERLINGRTLLTAAESERQDIVEYNERLQAILRPEFDYPLLRGFFGHLFGEESLFDAGSEMLYLSNQLYQDVQDKVTILSNEKRMAEIDTLTRELQSQSIGSMEGLTERVETLRQRYEEYAERHTVAVANRTRYAAIASATDTYFRRLESTLAVWDAEYDILREHIDYLFNEMCLAAYHDYNSAATTIEAQLQDIGNLEIRISSAREHLNEMETKHDRLQVLLAGMSPATGLLAKCAVRPVENFIEQMNRIIERVWTHELRILPYKPTDNVKLDYTFPMVVAGRENMVPDISEGSDGQHEIIDFAFMIVGLMRMGNKGIPLMLDETDRPLQPAHKENLMVLLREMVESGWFSQIFVISHHISAYSALPQADIIELNPRCATPEYNQVINFK